MRFRLAAASLAATAPAFAADPPPSPAAVLTAPFALPSVEASETPYPITLAAALKLANARPLDVAIAQTQVEIAARRLDQARLLWVPNLVTGIDYFRHEGGQQNFAGEILRSSRGTLMVGVGPNVVFSSADAVYAPLVGKQDLFARQAFLRAAENDVTLAVAVAYFDVQQARGELAGAVFTADRAKDVSTKAEELAKGLAPPLEATRARVELARRKQAVATARERWRVASAELNRLLRIDPTTVIEPAEPPDLPVTLIDAGQTPDTLIPIALTHRPELAAHQSLVQATLTRLKQEKLRPLLPSLALRSVSTNPSGSIGYGGFAGGPNDRFGGMQSRFDLDAQVLWEFSALGLGNRVRTAERRAEHTAATLELFRVQDRVAADVTVALAQSRAATDRLAEAGPALRDAADLVSKAVEGMSQTRRVGDTLTLVVRPQEVVAAVQLLAQATGDYYSAAADHNRAQFRLYRALGHPPAAILHCLPAEVETSAPGKNSGGKP